VSILFWPLQVIALQGVLKQSSYNLCFTPGGQCTHLIGKTILSAKKSVEVQAYSFTSKPIIHALIKAQQKGIDVFVLLDKSNIGMPYAVINALKENHIPFLIDFKPEIAHNKVMIIDNKTVITGSFNFTKAAQHYYAENVLVIHDKGLAEAYHLNFLLRKKVSESIEDFCSPATPMNASMCHQQSRLFRHLQQDHPWHRVWKRLQTS
jgi:phosphatidylserine/phosphatidylglycerophosphate/cardiolipin synthase-like enzyme